MARQLPPVNGPTISGGTFLRLSLRIANIDKSADTPCDRFAVRGNIFLMIPKKKEIKGSEF